MDVYQALASPVRREILAMLRDGPKSAGELADAFDLSKPTLSGHFAVLREAGLVASEREGAKVIYHLNLSVAEEALTGLMDVLRIGRPSGKPKGETP
ncbi:metalloregulator ArsR/SmtB family transcription factor [Parvularcula lutaonensis]|uniref:Metalloregulator ArsR/SmtB family transcription factor n=1 Tax=Parvularcula lutaonensis TaxID=491923 RepID=A0ABV7MAD3_9PROT|nr:metalloregulator ArsR/SmtB family transcription factor [Parvularcula lutaonensis]GGY46773.1 transcriptional regulator [Parvularcula lutaonensis]